MHCATCGANLYYLDVLVGNCVVTASGYAHTRASDCGSPERRSRSLRTAMADIVRVRRIKPSPASVQASQPRRPHNQAEHMGIIARVAQMLSSRENVSRKPPKVVPHSAGPVYGGIQNQVRGARVMYVSDNDGTDDVLELPIDHSRLPIPIDVFGYTDAKYWIHFDDTVFCGPRTKHMQGVQLAIADISNCAVPTLYQYQYKQSTRVLPRDASLHQIDTSAVFGSLDSPFGLRGLPSGEYTLFYNDHEITHPINAVLAGYVVAVRALMDSDR
jgi:hypothetical protein